jgi:DNA polymerase V
MATIETQVPKIEVYSIDECFVWLPGFSPAELDAQATKIRRIVKQNVGLPVSVGVAWTKTLAKLANNRSKKDERWKDLGVCNLTTFSIAELEKLLSEVGVEDVWGIGHRRAEVLRHYGIYTAYDLANAPDRWLLKHLTVVGLRTALELRGQPCIPAELAPVPKKSIISSKAFGRPIESLEELSQAVATYVSRLGEKLRDQHSVASTLEVFIHTSHFAKGRERYANAITVRLDQPTAYTPALVAAARRGLEKIYKPGVLYAKAGVMVMGLQSENARQLNLWHQGEGNPVTLERNRRLMEAVDELNYRFGRGTIQVGTAGLKKEWSMRREKLSQRYTTRWDELLVV